MYARLNILEMLPQSQNDHDEKGSVGKKDADCIGASLYQFKVGTLRNIGGWLTQLEIDRDKVVTAANASFEYHIDIFKELEATRVVVKDQPKTHSYSCSFFSLNKVVVAAATGLALAGSVYALDHIARNFRA